MPFGKNEFVPSWHPGIFRIDIHFLEIQHRQNIRSGQRPAGMAGTCTVNGFNDTDANIVGLFPQGLIIHCHVLSSLFYYFELCSCLLYFKQLFKAVV
jgi:hypothetical protein